MTDARWNSSTTPDFDGLSSATRRRPGARRLALLRRGRVAHGRRVFSLRRFREGRPQWLGNLLLAAPVRTALMILAIPFGARPPGPLRRHDAPARRSRPA